MKKIMKKYQTGGPKVKTPVTDSTAIYKERYKIAKEDFKKNPTQKTADETSKTITDMIQYHKRKNTPIVKKNMVVLLKKEVITKKNS